MQVPISEVFDSVQGEGTYAGTSMRFIRLAGCSVGKPPDQLSRFPNRDVPTTLQVLRTDVPAWVCWTYDGRGFCCDTDFAVKRRIELEDTIKLAWEDHICITGGEPLIHDQALFNAHNACRAENKQLHIETSGTKPIPGYLEGDWITISPKLGVREDAIARANEIKLLIDDGFRLELVPESIMRHTNVFIQPINLINHVDRHNILQCLDVLKQNPTWKLSVQLHKYIGVR